MEIKDTEILVDITNELRRNLWLEGAVDLYRKPNEIVFETRWRYVYYNMKTLTT